MKIWVLPLSALLHVAAIGAVLLPWLGGHGDSAADAQPIEVELVQQADAIQGGVPGPATAASSPTPADRPDPADADAVTRAAGSPQTPARPAVAAAVNLGNAAENRDGLDVTGQGVVPPGPDSRFRNQPPAYPVEAARMRMQGTVSLLIHVSARGLPLDVVVANSSGAAVLDHAARNAVRRWRFTPAQLRGNPVPFDYPIEFRFVLGNTHDSN